MNMDNPGPDPAPEEPTDGPAPSEKPDEPKKPRRHLLGLPPGYRFDPNAKPTLDDLYGTPACFGDDPLRPGEGRTESDGLSAGI
jgi:hypothetical protein